MTVLFTNLKVVTGKSDRHIAKIHTTAQLDSILCAYNLDWHYHKWKKWLSFSPPTRELLNIFEMSLVVHGLKVIVFVCDVIFSMRLQFALRYYNVLIRTYHTVLCTKIKHILYGTCGVPFCSCFASSNKLLERENGGQDPWWRHQMETFSALLTMCAGNSPVTCEFPVQRLVTRSFDVFLDLCLNKRLSKQWWGWWFGTPSSSSWHHCNAPFYCQRLTTPTHSKNTHFEQNFINT